MRGSVTLGRRQNWSQHRIATQSAWTPGKTRPRDALGVAARADYYYYYRNGPKKTSMLMNQINVEVAGLVDPLGPREVDQVELRGGDPAVPMRPQQTAGKRNATQLGGSSSVT